MSVDPKLTPAQLGAQAEHMVCADLIRHGYKPYLTAQFCAYDIAVDLPDRVLRIQVKGTKQAVVVDTIRRPHLETVYRFQLQRGNLVKLPYLVGDYDVAALVAVDIGRIAYLPPSQHRRHIDLRRPDGSAIGRQFDQFTIQSAIEEVTAA